MFKKSVARDKLHQASKLPVSLIIQKSFYSDYFEATAHNFFVTAVEWYHFDIGYVSVPAKLPYFSNILHISQSNGTRGK